MGDLQAVGTLIKATHIYLYDASLDVSFIMQASHAVYIVWRKVCCAMPCHLLRMSPMSCYMHQQYLTVPGITSHVCLPGCRQPYAVVVPTSEHVSPQTMAVIQPDLRLQQQSHHPAVICCAAAGWPSATSGSLPNVCWLPTAECNSPAAGTFDLAAH